MWQSNNKGHTGRTDTQDSWPRSRRIKLGARASAQLTESNTNRSGAAIPTCTAQCFQPVKMLILRHLWKTISPHNFDYV